jgi:uncharacterized BrkB/YihY/UPF0761 family membrane protein
VIGTLFLFVLAIVIMVSYNSVEVNETINKLGTIVISYPVLFIFFLMVDAFYSLLFDVHREKRYLLDLYRFCLF